jgi:hypothetical protein
MVYLVSYDLKGNEHPEAYSKVRAAIEQGATSVQHPLKSQWLVETSQPLTWWYACLRKEMDANDFLLITTITRGEYTGWLPKTVWPWLEARI